MTQEHLEHAAAALKLCQDLNAAADQRSASHQLDATTFGPYGHAYECASRLLALADWPRQKAARVFDRVWDLGVDPTAQLLAELGAADDDEHDTPVEAITRALGKPQRPSATYIDGAWIVQEHDGDDDYYVMFVVEGDDGFSVWERRGPSVTLDDELEVFDDHRALLAWLRQRGLVDR